MRKVLAVAIVTMLVFGTVGVLTVAEDSEVVLTFDVGDAEFLAEVVNIPDEVLGDVDGNTSVAGKTEVRVIKPKGVKDGTYEIKNEESTGDVLVIVDPIHVRG